jgi:hypothetical protein
LLQTASKHGHAAGGKGPLDLVKRRGAKTGGK